jgi:hypothetical protein
VERVEKEDIELWLAVNDQGDRAISFDGSREAIAELVDEHGGAAVRTVKMTVSMALPTAVEAEPIEVLDEAGATQTIETAIEEVEEAAAA